MHSTISCYVDGGANLDEPDAPPHAASVERRGAARPFARRRSTPLMVAIGGLLWLLIATAAFLLARALA